MESSSTHGSAASGAMMTYTFNGTYYPSRDAYHILTSCCAGRSISAIGTLGPLKNGVPPCGIFVFDSTSPTMLIPPPASTTMYHQLFYNSPVVAFGTHTLTLRIDASTDECGSGQKIWPFFLDYLQISLEEALSSSNSPFSPAPTAFNSVQSLLPPTLTALPLAPSLFGTASTTASNTGIPSHPHAAPETHRIAVVAGIVGGVVVLSVLFGTVLCYWRHGSSLCSRRQRHDFDGKIGKYLVGLHDYMAHCWLW